MLAFLLVNMEKEEKQDKPVGYFKVDEEFLKGLDQILLQNFVIERFRKQIIKEFIKLIKSRIVKKE